MKEAREVSGFSVKGSAESSAKRPALNITLWIIQALLALLFLWAGGLKLVLPIEAMEGPVKLPGLFLRFIGMCEVLGAIGLILPSLLRIKPGLTPLAAAGLIIIMIGATVITVMTSPAAMAIMPFVAGILLVFVAYGRWRLVPMSSR